MANDHKEQITRLVEKWITEFHLPLDDDAAQKSIESVFSPDIAWNDHAFHIQRTGHAAVLGLRKAFNHCNQPMETRIKNLYHTATGAIVEAIWIGNCKNDIVRPNGDIAVKANGKDFVCHVCFVTEIDPVKGITKIDEYYNKAWWHGVSEADYHKISGASMKQKG